jgi:hypothetical protein
VKKVSLVARHSGPPAQDGELAQMTALFKRIVGILEHAQARVVRAVNSEMVLAYWQIGREIVEHLQGGEDHAGYGEKLIEELSGRLGGRFGRGYSTTNLRYFRTFYLAYPTRKPEIRHIQGGESFASRLPVGSTVQDEIRHTQGGVLENLEHATLKDGLDGFSPRLGWAHYRALMKVEHTAARRFYEIEAEREGWSVEHLERQIHTQLFARLLKSRDKAGCHGPRDARGQTLERP